MRLVQQKLKNILILVTMMLVLVIKCHHINMEQYIPYSLICDLFCKNLETYLQSYTLTPSAVPSSLMSWGLFMLKKSFLNSRHG